MKFDQIKLNEPGDGGERGLVWETIEGQWEYGIW